MFANYHYQRGYLDGRGYGDRGTGKTGRNILDAVMTASETKSDVFFVCDNDMCSKVEFRKTMDVARLIGFNFEATTGGNIYFENGSTIKFVSKQNIRGIAESMMGCCFLRNPLLIFDIDNRNLCSRDYENIDKFKYMIQARTR